MDRDSRFFCFLVFTLAASVGCSSKPSAEANKINSTPDKIVGKAQVLIENLGASDTALNAGGSNVYLWHGTHRYRLFLRTPADITHGNVYVAEGVNAQKMVEDLGDPDQGKNGYPLQTSCQKAIKTAWPGLAFDEADTQAEVLRLRMKRYPARAVFLVVRIRPATAEEAAGVTAQIDKDEAAAEAKVPEIDVAAEKEHALLIGNPPALTAPLWEPEGGTVKCAVGIGPDGKIAELQTGKQLCEAVDWTQYNYKPTMEHGKAVKVNTEVEVRFEARK
jgi:hypothetical protein